MEYCEATLVKRASVEELLKSKSSLPAGTGSRGTEESCEGLKNLASQAHFGCCAGCAAESRQASDRHSLLLKEMITKLHAIKGASEQCRAITSNATSELAAIRVASEGCSRNSGRSVEELASLKNVIKALLEVVSSLAAAVKKMFTEVYGLPMYGSDSLVGLHSGRRGY